MKLIEVNQRYLWYADRKDVRRVWASEVKNNNQKIIVLDDDPTGIQTVNDVPVYTSWSKELPKKIEFDNSKVSFVWTNSRAANPKEAERLYQTIAQDILDYYHKSGTEFTIITRSDSTLRGNYPEETRAFDNVWKDLLPIDAEIIIPFFSEGGRYTIDDVHYLMQGDELIPCADTEFAKDKTFGYTSSDLKQWVVEKHGEDNHVRVISISLQELRNADNSGAYKKLIDASGFDKIIVNAVDMDDLKVLVCLLNRAIRNGKRYIYRTAASFVNAISGIISDKAGFYFKYGEKGLFVAGSHTALTTVQIESLLESGVAGLELNIKCLFEPRAMHKEIRSLKKKAVLFLKQNKSVCIFTPREYQAFKGKTNLEIAKAVSEALVNITRQIYRYADYIVAKGGITSHEIAVRALKIKKAKVLGQIISGVPVITANDVFRKQLSFTIFPGNVGYADSLVQIKQKYEGGGNCEIHEKLIK